MSSFFRNMAKLADICYNELPKNKIIVEYLKKREISKKTIDKFFIGAFPLDLRVLLKEFKSDFLIKTDILYKADSSPFKYYPLIIPIWDANNNFIGIGGRTFIPEEERKAMGYPKYKNSKYDKANHLFGLNYAKQAIRSKNTSVVVEGYFDVISSHQAGLDNVVATSGTFLSNHQIMLLSRYGENIKILFDNDPAGKRATERSLKHTEILGVNIKEMTLPQGYKDIDEYIIKNKSCNFNLL